MERGEMKLREWFPETFRRHANELVAWYGAPIWLIGSALRTETPRDIDVLVVISEEEAWRLYGRVIGGQSKNPRDFEDWEWRRARDRIKRSRLCGSWCGYPIDMKIQLEAEAAAHAKEDRVRLDTAPEWVIGSGKGAPADDKGQAAEVATRTSSS